MCLRYLLAASLLILLAVPAMSETADETPLPTVQLSLPGGQTLTLEKAVTPHQQNLGLMFRPALAADHGMLFPFSTTDRHGIWMKNMLIPIDILWLDDHRTIVHIEPNVPPCRQEPCLIYQPPTPARYVIELAAGAAAKDGLATGLSISLPASD